MHTGSGGLDELEDEFVDGKVMWAFVRVKDPGSNLPKFVLINWVSRSLRPHVSSALLTPFAFGQLGDGVPVGKKGLFPSHSAAVAKFLKGCAPCV